MTSTSDPDGDRSAQTEVERLRAEVDRLAAALDHEDPPDAAAKSAEPRSQWWRKIIVGVCVLLAAVLAPLAVVATWAHDAMSDTDRYVQTVAPLADDPAVQDVVITRISDAITSRLNVHEITQEAVDALAQRGLPPRAAESLGALLPALDNGIDNFVHTQVTKLVRSEEFAAAWEQANREAHTQMVAVLTGKTGDAVEVKGNAVQLNLAVLINTVKARLVDRGFTLAERLPTITATFTLFESADLARAQTGFRLLSASSTTLPILALLFLAAAVALSRRHRRTLMVGALAVAASMLVLGAALNLSRIVYLDAIPTDRLPSDAAAAIFDQLVWFIRLNLRALLVLFLAVAFVAWVSGPEPAPVSVRRGTSRALDVVRHGSDRAGLNTGPFGLMLGRYRGAIRGVVLGLVVVLYVMAAHPTGGYTITLLVVAAVVLLVVELLARSPEPAATDVPT
ncbi:hypothetical protein [Marmoricola sp. URHB0036]|uniref:hypothetical protein n=1 Tax=Marmoricola sp. URHB0036 TaxID=1298863 RepID=UPI000422F9CD|nr:hypothetical protein [Marmoricola sp. URHB0036]